MMALPLFFFFSFFVAQSLGAQEARIVVELPYDTVGVDEVFELRYKIEQADVLQMMPPQFVGFELIAGPMTSTNVSIINGKTTKSTSYSYRLRAAAGEGRYDIPILYAQTSAGDIQSLPLSLHVQSETPERPYDTKNSFAQPFGFGQGFGGSPFGGGEDMFRSFEDVFEGFGGMGGLDFPQFQMPDMGSMQQQMQDMMEQFQRSFDELGQQQQKRQEEKKKPKTYKL